MQSEIGASDALVVRGITFDGQADWVFAPQGWDIAALERQFQFSSTPESRLRTAVIMPSQLKQLVEVYGETPAVDLPSNMALSRLMNKNMLAVQLLIVGDQAASSTMPL